MIRAVLAWDLAVTGGLGGRLRPPRDRRSRVTARS